MRTRPWSGCKKTGGAPSGACRNAAAKASGVVVKRPYAAEVEAPVEVQVAWIPSLAQGELGSGVDERNAEELNEEERSGESWNRT